MLTRLKSSLRYSFQVVTLHFSRQLNGMDGVKFDNLALRVLPLDAVKENYTRTVSGACFSLIEPTPVENPQLVSVSTPALALIGIDTEAVTESALAEVFSGNQLLEGSQAAAHCYCGHQFGYFSGQLGDGATMYLGEVVNGLGERWELQLKGAGKTPYSRSADGRKVLRSSIREFLCSEAMYNLGVATTRAATCVTSDSRVVRDIFYDGHPINERCTIVSRIAPSFIRFGSFEIFKPRDPQTDRAGPSVGRNDILEKLLHYVIGTFYPEIWSSHSEDKKTCYLEFYSEVVRRTAKLVADWQCVGFCHGVLNTDNMSILGLTIDYGPYGFMDYFDPGYVCNASDNDARYDYVNQPAICKWNLLKLAEALSPLLPLDESKPALQEIYDSTFKEEYYARMRRKLGLTQSCDLDRDERLVQGLLRVMHETSADFTNVFRLLSDVDAKDGDERNAETIVKFVEQCQPIAELNARKKPAANTSQLEMLIGMAEGNPGILRRIGASLEQLTAELARIRAEEATPVESQHERNEKNKQAWTEWLVEYRKCLCDELDGIQVDEQEKFQSDRVNTMKSTNPRVILRNHIAQSAIKAAEEGDFSEVRRVLAMLENPFSDDLQILSTDEAVSQKQCNASEASPTKDIISSATCDGEEEMLSRKLASYVCKPPPWAAELRVG